MKRRILFPILCLLSILLLASCDQPRRQTGVPGVPLLTFERTGGIAGFQDRLVIGYGGEYYLKRSGRPERIGSLSPGQLARLKNWMERIAPFTLRLEDNPNGPDNLVRQLSWTGLGRAVPDEAQQYEIMNWAVGLLDELSAPPDTQQP
ncbi:MAG: hypothetical protein ACP5Q1_08015 [Anaerolineae bacterium]